MQYVHTVAAGELRERGGGKGREGKGRGYLCRYRIWAHIIYYTYGL